MALLQAPFAFLPVINMQPMQEEWEFILQLRFQRCYWVRWLIVKSNCCHLHSGPVTRGHVITWVYAK